MKTLALRFAAVAAGLFLVACGDAASDDFSNGFEDLNALSAETGAQGSEDEGNALAVPIDPARELLVTDLSVVEDPLRTTWPAGARSGSQAVWTFGYLMEQMAGS